MPIPAWSTLTALLPHGYCLSWRPDLLLLHAVSDLATTVSYYTIPAALVLFAWRRQDLHFRWIFVLFGVFILACGTTHLMSVWTLWQPDYLAAGIVKAVTAVASVATAVVLLPLIPKALALPGPAQWEAVNQSLRQEIAERGQAETEVRHLNAELEARVAQRTAELEAANRHLAEANRELSEREQRFQCVVESAPHAMLLADHRGHITLVNAQTEKLFGYGRDELLGCSVELLVPERFRRTHAGQRETAFAAHSARPMGSGLDLCGRHRDGRDIPVDISLTPVRSAEGEAILLSIVDMTERKQAEAERAARQAAEASSRAKSEFLAAMSHELRTPLNAILGYAQILARRAAGDPRLAAGLDTIRQSGQHLLTLINDLLDLAKIEAGRFELVPTPVSPAALLAGVADIIRIKAEEKSLRFDFAPNPDLPAAVLADEKRLRQVLLNLLGNAVKFTDHGQVALHASATSDGVLARLTFEVSDSGVGIAPGQLEAIFEPFEQAGETSRRASGTGLGLAISRRLVRQMGGDIRVESCLGQGSRFRFEIALPLAQAQAAPARRPHPVAYAGARRKVLVADDVAANRAVLADMLAELGFIAQEAGDGNEALAAIADFAPDLILMDRGMPKLDGLEACRRLRATPGLEQLPVVMVSAGAAAEGAAEARAAGANAFLSKPIDEAQLVEVLGSCLGLAWRHAEEAPAVQAADAPFVVPPAADLRALHALARAGSMRDIRRHAEQLAAADPRLRPFAERLLQLAGSYQSKALLALVEEHLPREIAP